MGRDPVTGEPQVRAYAVYRPASERVAQRAKDLGPDLGPAERAKAVAAIEAEEAGVWEDDPAS
ncbi:MAG TPA: hypothetical protein VJQ61_02360 [Sinomonas sp.]|nr:hypothetical protein [Sinomonas sp.]